MLWVSLLYFLCPVRTKVLRSNDLKIFKSLRSFPSSSYYPTNLHLRPWFIEPKFGTELVKGRHTGTLLMNWRETRSQRRDILLPRNLTTILVIHSIINVSRIIRGMFVDNFIVRYNYLYVTRDLLIMIQYPHFDSRSFPSTEEGPVDQSDRSHVR